MKNKNDLKLSSLNNDEVIFNHVSMSSFFILIRENTVIETLIMMKFIVTFNQFKKFDYVFKD